MSYTVVWSEVARADLRDICDSLLEITSPVSTEKLALEIRQSTRWLPEHPFMYQVFEYNSIAARHIVVRNSWRVLYTVDEVTETCTVLAVVSTRRDRPI